MATLALGVMILSGCGASESQTAASDIYPEGVNPKDVPVREFNQKIKLTYVTSLNASYITPEDARSYGVDEDLGINIYEDMMNELIVLTEENFDDSIVEEEYIEQHGVTQKEEVVKTTYYLVTETNPSFNDLYYLEQYGIHQASAVDEHFISVVSRSDEDYDEAAKYAEDYETADGLTNHHSQIMYRNGDLAVVFHSRYTNKVDGNNAVGDNLLEILKSDEAKSIYEKYLGE